MTDCLVVVVLFFYLLGFFLMKMDASSMWKKNISKTALKAGFWGGNGGTMLLDHVGGGAGGVMMIK